MNPGTGTLRLFTAQVPDSAKNYWEVPNLLLQKFPADVFMVTTKLNFSPNPKLEGEKTGLIIMGLSYANLAVKSNKKGISLVYTTCAGASKGNPEKEKVITELNQPVVYLRVKINQGGICQFSYSLDGHAFKNAGETFQATEGQWIGAKMGLFASRSSVTNDSGYADFDWFSVEPVN